MSAVVLKEPVRVPDRSFSSESRSTPVLSTPVTSCVPVGVLSVMLVTSLLMLLPATVTVEVIPETFAMSAAPFCQFQETRRPAGYEDREGEGLADRDGRVQGRTRPGGMAPIGAAVAAPERRIAEVAHEDEGADEVRKGAGHIDPDVAADRRGVRALDTLRGRARDRREDHVVEVGEAGPGTPTLLHRHPR